MQEAYQENKEFSDISYWVQGTSDSEISEWWIFGADGQGDFGCLILKEKFSSTIMIKSVCVKKTSNVWKLIFYNGYN